MAMEAGAGEGGVRGGRTLGDVRDEELDPGESSFGILESFVILSSEGGPCRVPRGKKRQANQSREA